MSSGRTPARGGAAGRGRGTPAAGDINGASVPPNGTLRSATNPTSSSSAGASAGPNTLGSTGPSRGRQASSTPGPAMTGTRSPSAGSATQSMIRPRGAAPPQRMMFRPVMPPRRPVQIKTEPGLGSPAPVPSSSSHGLGEGEGRGRGRGVDGRAGRGGRGDGRGRGRGRGSAPVELVASGPFSMGSSSAHTGVGGRKGASGASRPHLYAPSQSAGDNDGGGIKSDPSRSIYRNPDAAALKEREEYSDPEEDGIEIIDMDDVATLDELAPRALPRMKDQTRKSKVKREADKGVQKTDQEAGKKNEFDEEEKAGSAGASSSGKMKIKADPDALVVDEVEDDLNTPTPPPPNASAGIVADADTEKNEDARAADALDLDASEDEEVMDDLVEDFVAGLGINDEDDPDNRLYLFQFPPLFPKFEVPQDDLPKSAGEGPSTAPKRRSVAFADDTLGGGGAAGSSPGPSIKLEGTAGSSLKDDPDADSKLGPGAKSRKAMGPAGQIGRLDVFRDGRVSFNFGGNLVMELTGGSHSSFLQQVMVLDAETKKATTLGELHRKFVVSPEVESMLADYDVVDEGQ